MDFNLEDVYIVVRDHFDALNNRIVKQLKLEHAGAIKGEIDLTEFLGKGVSVYLCYYICRTDQDGEDDGCEIVVWENGVGYGFSAIEALGDFPRIEGDFAPGIYFDEEVSEFYELHTLKNLSELVADYGTGRASYDDFKLICRDDEFVTTVTSKNVQLENEVRTPRFPFSYFDVNCPFCSRIVVTGQTTLFDHLRCVPVERKCRHFVGETRKRNGAFVTDSLNLLSLKYEIKDGDLFLLTAVGWQKTFVYCPPTDPAISYWGTDSMNYADVFLFLESGDVPIENSNE